MLRSTEGTQEVHLTLAWQYLPAVTDYGRRRLCEVGCAVRSPGWHGPAVRADGPHLGPSRTDPRLVYRVHPGPRGGDKRKGFTEADYARLPGAAHQQLGGPVVLVWDNLNTHVSKAMAALVAARDWLKVFQLPAYASELNPVESVWALLKRSLANLLKRSLSELTALIKTRITRMQYRPALLNGFLTRTRLNLTPLCNPSN
jgi:hypothetical protein